MVSIVIPVKGRSEFLSETLGSLVAQTDPGWEAVVVDDGSTPEELARIEELTRVDARIRFFRREGSRGGASVCRNEGFRAGRGEYVLFLDSDDLLAPECLTGRVKAIRERPDVDFVVFGIQLFQRRPGDMPVFWNTLIEAEDDVRRFLRVDPPWGTHAVLWRRDAVQRAGLWDESARCWQDWEFHLRALLAGLRYAKVPVGDCHWRFLASGSLSKAAPDPSRMLARIGLVEGMVARLRSLGRLDEDLRLILGGLMLRLALPWFGPRPWGAGTAILGRARATGLVPGWQVLMARVVLAVNQLPWTRRASLVCERRLIPMLRHGYTPLYHSNAPWLVGPTARPDQIPPGAAPVS